MSYVISFWLITLQRVNQRVKNFSIYCKFGDRLEAILLDKLITGLKNGQVLDRLCEETEDITLQKALEIALHQESSIIEEHSDDCSEFEIEHHITT